MQEGGNTHSFAIVQLATAQSEQLCPNKRVALVAQECKKVEGVAFGKRSIPLKAPPTMYPATRYAQDTGFLL
jgi:hypothetical protein